MGKTGGTVGSQGRSGGGSSADQGSSNGRSGPSGRSGRSSPSGPLSSRGKRRLTGASSSKPSRSGFSSRSGKRRLACASSGKPSRSGSSSRSGKPRPADASSGKPICSSKRRPAGASSGKPSHGGKRRPARASSGKPRPGSQRRPGVPRRSGMRCLTVSGDPAQEQKQGSLPVAREQKLKRKVADGGADLEGGDAQESLRKPRRTRRSEAEAPRGKDAFPITGRPIVLKILCSHAESNHPLTASTFEGHNITSDWELPHLLQVTEMMTGVSRCCQKLYHAGQELPACTTIRGILGVDEEHLPDRFAVHVIINEERFPQCFGPLNIIEVPLTPDDIMLPQSTKSGFHWMMKPETVERFGVRAPSVKQITAQCSPSQKVTLSERDRAKADIPPEAVEFAWSNPIANWELVEEDPHLREESVLCVDDSSSVKDFFVVGGFIFMDKQQRPLKVMAASLKGDMHGGLHFGMRETWQQRWTKALIGDGRFHRVTCEPLLEAGAHFFCWLRPGETFEDDFGKPLEQQPCVPHGGFAFLFHEMGASSAQKLARDCYFAVEGVQAQVPAHASTATPPAASPVRGRRVRGPKLAATAPLS